MNSFKTSQFKISFEDTKIKNIIISRIDDLRYDNGYYISDVDSICDRLFHDGQMTNKERVKIISKAAQFFYQ